MCRFQNSDMSLMGKTHVKATHNHESTVEK